MIIALEWILARGQWRVKQEGYRATTAVKSNYCNNNSLRTTDGAYSIKVVLGADRGRSITQGLQWSMELQEVTLLCTEETFCKIKWRESQISLARIPFSISLTKKENIHQPALLILRARLSNKTSKLKEKWIRSLTSICEPAETFQTLTNIWKIAEIHFPQLNPTMKKTKLTLWSFAKTTRSLCPSKLSIRAQPLTLSKKQLCQSCMLQVIGEISFLKKTLLALISLTRAAQMAQKM